MQYNVQFGTHVKPTHTVTNYIEKKMPNIARFFKKYQDDEVILDIHFDKIPERDEYWTTMNLSVQSMVFHVEEKGHDAFVSIDATKKALISEIKTFKEKVSKYKKTEKDEWKDLIEKDTYPAGVSD